MAIKDILVQVDGGQSAPARYQAAIQLAQTHGAHLTGLCLAIEPPVPATILGMVPPEVMVGQRETVRAQAESAVSQFRLASERAGIPGGCRIVEVLQFDATESFIQHARHADLMVLGQADPNEVTVLGPGFAADVVIGSGRPAIVVPYIGIPPLIGQRVLIAWDGGREATRAVHDALPILKRAHSVTVLSVNPETSSNGNRRDPGADISLHLARHDVRVAAARTIAREVSVGDALLADIADNGIDLLVMGAYGHSRLREFVLGGVTRHMLAHMTAPVLMSH
jgi:nucleotide-binding universal stress UspA family protein